MNYSVPLLRGCCILTVLLFTLSGAVEPETFLNSYNLLSTIAGKGSVDDKAVNGWQVSYEGGDARAAELSRPHMAMADSIGNVFIADKDAHAIRMVDVNGIITTVAGTNTAGDGDEGTATETALNAPNGLWVNKAGEFYILDLNNSKIRKVDLQGIMTTVVHDSDGIAVGRGLWVSQAEDTVWWANGSSVKMWTAADGITILADGFSGLGNITQDNDGKIIATDRVGNSVYRINGPGDKTVIAGNGTASGGGDGSSALETGFYGVRGVWWFSDDSYLLATHEGSKVWYVDPEGIAHIFLDGAEGDEYHSGDGQNYRTSGAKVSEVRAVTVDYQGNVLVTENDRGFIRKVSKGNNAVHKSGRRIYAETITLCSRDASGDLYLLIQQPCSRTVTIGISDLKGRRIIDAQSYKLAKGKNQITVAGERLPAGVVIVRIGGGVVASAAKSIRLN